MPYVPLWNTYPRFIVPILLRLNPIRNLRNTLPRNALGGGNGGGSGTGGLELCVSNLRQFDNGSQEEEELKAIDDLFTLVECLLDLDRMCVFKLIHNTQPTNNNHDNDNNDNNDKKRNHNCGR